MDLSKQIQAKECLIEQEAEFTNRDQPSKDRKSVKTSRSASWLL